MQQLCSDVFHIEIVTIEEPCIRLNPNDRLILSKSNVVYELKKRLLFHYLKMLRSSLFQANYHLANTWFSYLFLDNDRKHSHDRCATEIFHILGLLIITHASLKD